MKNKRMILTIILSLFVLLLIYSFYHIYNIVNDEEVTEKIINEVKDNIVIDYSTISDDEDILENEENEYLERNFEKLKDINDDTIGWIYVDGTNIDYPIVQGEDNDYYLNHSFYRESNSNGWIYMNYKNSSDFSDQNTIIYGHNTNGRTMFSDLKKIYDRELDSKNIKIYLEDDILTYQIFSIYLVDSNDSLSISKYVSDISINEFIKRSKIDFNIDVNDDDKILTLSTCHNVTDKRIIVHAKLIR